ncbi:MAG: hypothetical protein HYT38_01335 [Candidatus Sungbacteria bacterium]|uniref:Uncharacterized protein n=1 Tax=Candidatus Sungiibacteriota bacterium TaxID=2750080 RepID=A0A9D6HPN5_9BACT|nr:hypothetical protein [Candidatus Sungbacteria bacterium]
MPKLPSYSELVCKLSEDSRREFLIELGTEKLQRVIEYSVNQEHLPITLTMDTTQFVVVSMDDMERLIAELAASLSVET